MKYGDFCAYCGAMMGSETWPRECLACKMVMYRNPTPVGAAVVPVYKPDHTLGVFVIRRGIEPQKGKLAIPGGFMECGETWQQAIVRELREETGGGLNLSAGDVHTFHVETSLHNNILLVFGITERVAIEAVKFTPNNEVAEYAVLWEPEELAFPTHTKVCQMFFDRFHPRNLTH